MIRRPVPISHWTIASSTLVPFMMLAGLALAADTAPPAAEYREPRGYVCFRTDSPPSIDGRLDEPAWQAASWTEDFGDIEGAAKPKPRYRTRAKMLWDNRGLYVAAEFEEPHVWGAIRKHDSVIFHDNDFEVFLDPDGDGHNYGEFEMNALNATWDLRLNKPYKDGGKADDGWEIPGLRSAVHIRGTINDPSDTDQGWSVEIFFPWQISATLQDRSAPVREARREGSLFVDYAPPIVPGPKGWTPLSDKDATQFVAQSSIHLQQLAANPPAPPLIPRDGDRWRINFSRVEWQHTVSDGKYSRTPNRPEDNWVWSPQGKVDMHRPETWGYLQFSTARLGSTESKSVALHADATGPARHLLQRVYYAQQAFRQRESRFAKSLDELDLANLTHATLVSPIRLSTLPDAFEASVDVRSSNGTRVRCALHNDAWFQTAEAPRNP